MISIMQYSKCKYSNIASGLNVGKNKTELMGGGGGGGGGGGWKHCICSGLNLICKSHAQIYTARQT